MPHLLGYQIPRSCLDTRLNQFCNISAIVVDCVTYPPRLFCGMLLIAKTLRVAIDVSLNWKYIIIESSDISYCH